MDNRSLKNQLITIGIALVGIYLAVKLMPFFLKSILLPMKILLFIVIAILVVFMINRWRRD